MGYWSNGYYYRHGRYFGNGEAAVLAEAFDRKDTELARRDRDQAREARRTERQALREARQQAAGRLDRFPGIDRGGVLAADRHAWRKIQTMATQIQSQAVEAATLELAELANSLSARQSVKRRPGRTTSSQQAQSTPSRTGGPRSNPGAQACRRGRGDGLGRPVGDRAGRGCKPPWIEPGDRSSPHVVAGRLSQALQTVEKVRRLARPRGPMVAIQVNRMTAPEPPLAIVQ